MIRFLAGVIVGSLALLLGYWAYPQLNTQTPPTSRLESTPTAMPSSPPSPPVPLATAADDEARTIHVYEQRAPAVVSVVVRSTVYSFFDSYQREGEGSGFVIDAQGHIITNYHVIEDAEQIDIIFADGTRHPARIQGLDPGNDLALLQLETLPEQLSSLPLGDGSSLKVGQDAIAIGNPFGRFGQTLTTGVISALGRTIEGRNNRTIYDIIQTDAAINRGNSGGPLLNSAGEVIGINTAIYSPSGTNSGVGFAISVETLKRVLPDLRRLGYYRNPTLGIEAGYSLDATIARELNLPSPQGILLVRIDSSSPLLHQGIRAAQRQQFIRGQPVYLGGDILLAIDEHEVGSIRQLRDVIVNQYVVGDDVRLKLLQQQANGSWQAITVQAQLQAERR